MKFYVLSLIFFFISSKGKRKRIGLKFERMRGHRSGKIIFPGWKLYRFALECLIKDRILSLAGFVLPTMNRRDLAINGNREFLLGLARRCFVAWQCMMYSLWIYRRKRTHTNLYAYIDVSCTHTYTHTHTRDLRHILADGWQEGEYWSVKGSPFKVVELRMNKSNSKANFNLWTCEDLNYFR